MVSALDILNTFTWDVAIIVNNCVSTTARAKSPNVAELGTTVFNSHHFPPY
jgi:hypothetical protein